MYFILIGSIILNIVLSALLIRKYRQLHPNENILKDILSEVNKENKNYVDSSADSIIKVLKKYYKIDYCTLFIIQEGGLKIISSDVDECDYDDIIDYCKNFMRKSNEGIITLSETYLNYNSARRRKVKYSYFVRLGFIGAIYLENKEQYSNNDFELEFFKLVVKNIELILKNCMYQDELSRLAMKDNLTDLYNRNYMNKHITELLFKQNRLSIAIMDIDHFKNVNDIFGHDFGDKVLKDVSKFVKNSLGTDDEIYRWGGEEFIISFINKDIKDVEYRLNLIRESLAQYEIVGYKDKIKVTASFGVTNYNTNFTLSENISKADAALYKSKSEGRNRVSLLC